MLDSLEASLAGAGAGDQYVAEHEGFRLGQLVRARGWDGDWVVSEIMPVEAGEQRSNAFHLRTATRDESEGFQTRYGTLPHGSERARYVWIWVRAEELRAAAH